MYLLKHNQIAELLEKALALLKTMTEKSNHFEDLAATMKKMKRTAALDLVK